MSRPLTALAAALCIALTPSAVLTEAAVAGSGQYNLPSLGTVAGADLTVLDERALGQELMRRVRADASYMNDPETTDYLNRLGLRLVAAGESTPFNFFFFPIRDRSLNAFTLPGGFIAVHSGLIVATHSESELAGVIGHEIGHVTQRHIARRLQEGTNSWAATIGSILLAVLAARAGGSSGGDAAMGIVMGTQAAMLQKQLGYSRDAEREADRTGFETLSAAGFDPRGMEEFFERMQKNNRWQETIATTYVSTHPLTSERIVDMQNRTRTMPAVQHRDSLDYHLIQARMRVLQQTRYDGWQQAAKHFEEALKQNLIADQKAAAHYGLSVAYARMNKKAEALAQAQKACQTVGTANLYLDKNLAECTYAAAGNATQKKRALETARQMTERWPYSSLAVSEYAELLYQEKQHETLISMMRRQNALTKDDPDYYALLARSYEALGQKTMAYSHTGDMYALMGNHKAAVYQFELAQKAADGDFYVMSEVDAKLRRERRIVLDHTKD